MDCGGVTRMWLIWMYLGVYRLGRGGQFAMKYKWDIGTDSIVYKVVNGKESRGRHVEISQDTGGNQPGNG